jgi:hypothetical protein
MEEFDPNEDSEAEESQSRDAPRVFRHVTPEKGSRRSQDTGPEPDHAASLRPYHQIPDSGRRALPPGDPSKNPFCDVNVMHRKVQGVRTPPITADMIVAPALPLRALSS